MTISATIERHDTDNRHSISALVRLQPASAINLLASIREDWSTSVRLKGESQELIISSSNGSFVVFAKLGGDEFYDLIGDETATGWTEFVHGGEPAHHPRRHCVTENLAQAVTEAFLEIGKVDISANNWERQGETQQA